MAQQAESATQLQLGWLSPTAETLFSGTTWDRGQTEDETGDFHGLSQIAGASTFEEPGAIKPHAGICAGAVG
jgi:hypothetical protein